MFITKVGGMQWYGVNMVIFSIGPLFWNGFIPGRSVSGIRNEFIPDQKINNFLMRKAVFCNK